MKILDCTLRDGGYYTNWNFDDILVKKMVKTLDNNGVDIIELGYKSPAKGGSYRKCNDGYIKNIVNFNINCELSFMIDAKDFIDINNEVDYDLLNSFINNSDSSPFNICRLAIKFDEIIQAQKIAKYILDKGYKLFINLMGISLLSECKIIDFITSMQSYASVLYFADSYGNLKPNAVKNICKLFKDTTSLDCGMHCHDNLGLAFANSLQAIDSGFSYLDGTVCGMGRGVGNTKTEQLILYREENLTSSIIDITNSFEKLKQKYAWGFNPLYMMAGLKHIHPLFVQDLTLSGINSMCLSDTIKLLENQHKYDKTILDKIKTQRAVVIIPARYKSSRFPGKPLAKIHGKEMILYVAEKASIAVGKDNVYIATENEEIAKIVQSYGYRALLTSDNCLTGTDRVAEASLEIDADIFVNVQGDEPMINPSDILRAIQYKKDNPNSVINCMAKLNADENCDDKKIPKIVCDKNNNLLYASRNALPGNKNGNSQNVMKQVCIYALSKDELMFFYNQHKKSPLEYQEDIEILRFVENGVPVKMLETNHISYSVDYPRDIATIEKAINHG